MHDSDSAPAPRQGWGSLYKPATQGQHGGMAEYDLGSNPNESHYHDPTPTPAAPQPPNSPIYDLGHSGETDVEKYDVPSFVPDGGYMDTSAVDEDA